MGDMADMLMGGEPDFFGDDETSLPLPKTCRYCGTTGLEWGQDSEGRWRLHDRKGIHQCRVRPLPPAPKPRVVTDPIEKAFYAGYEAGYEACGAKAWPEVGMSFETTKEQDYAEYLQR